MYHLPTAGPDGRSIMSRQTNAFIDSLFGCPANLMARRSLARKGKREYGQLEKRQLLAGVATEFAGDSELYQVFSNHGRVGYADLDNQSFVLAADDAGQKVEVAGFRQADSFAYGLFAADQQLVRIGSNGAFETLGSVTGLPTGQGTYLAGDFAEDGLLYVKNATEHNKLYGINVDSQTVESTITLSQDVTNIWDIAFNEVDDKFYTSRRHQANTLISIDMSGVIEVIGEVGLSKKTFGTMYTDSTGSVFGRVNHTGKTYRFDTQTGEATLVGLGPVSGVNDGFSDPSKVLEFKPFVYSDEFVSYGFEPVMGNALADCGNGADTDGNQDQLSVTQVESLAGSIGSIVTLESGAELTMNSDGSFVYDPLQVFSESELESGVSETFTYEVSDTNGNTSQGSVTITFVQDNAVISLGDVQGEDGDGDEGHLLRGMDLYTDLQVSVANLGDINGDGLDDQMFGVAESDLAGVITGEAFVVFGTTTPSVNSKTDKLRSSRGGDGSEGFVLDGEKLNDFTGYSVTGGMDINGDGLNDMVIGARDADSGGLTNNGRVYVFYGKSGGYDAEYDLTDLFASNGGDGSEGFVVNGLDSHDMFSQSLAMGDLNGDGLGDLIIGATDSDAKGRTNSGEVFVLFGSSDGFAAEVDASSLYGVNGGDGSEGFVIQGAAAHDRLGHSVDAAGDYNNDGYTDLVIGAPNVNNLVVDTGAAYVFYGKAGLFQSEVDLFMTNLGVSKLLGNEASDFAGTSVSSAGDFNNDGIDDVMIGSPGCDVDGNSDAGRVYVAYGQSGGFGFETDLSSFLSENGGDGSSGMVINGMQAWDQMGTAVSAGGDFDGDGTQDIMIGARFASRYGVQNSGESYILFGADHSSAEMDVEELKAENGGDGTDGLVITGRRYYDSTGDNLVNAGDVNGDGRDDIIVMGHRVNPATNKQCYAEAYYIYGFDNQV